MYFAAGLSLRLMPILVFLLSAFIVHSVIAAGSTTLPIIPSGADLQDGDTFVFLGDSIAHQRLYTQEVETFFYTRFPEPRIRFHNAGVEGAQVQNTLQRMQKDVTGFKPKSVSLLPGIMKS